MRSRATSQSGQTTLLTLASPLPGQFVPIATGDAGTNGSYTIAGYGTAREAERMHSAGLKEARLVADSRYGGLVDPQPPRPDQRQRLHGRLGGPVAKFDGKRYVLVGIVERVSNYAGIGACGFLTHFSAVSGSSNFASAPAATRQPPSRAARARLQQEAAPLGVSALTVYEGARRSGAEHSAPFRFRTPLSPTCADQSTLISAALISGHHFAISAF